MSSHLVSNVFKVIIIGDPRVGKTTLRLRYIGEGFRKQYISTIGADFALATYNNYILQIWDLAGQDDFQSMVTSFYKGAQGIIIVFDITNEESRLNIPKWIDRFQIVEGQLVPIVIFGNKIDLRKGNKNSMQIDEGIRYIQELSEKYQIEINYYETSALTGENINAGFEGLINRLMK